MNINVQIDTNLLDQMEKEYLNFKIENKFDDLKEKICFLGINLDNDKNVITNFKIYLEADINEIAKEVELINQLQKREMVHVVNRVIDKENETKLRYDIGLLNRNNENMCWLYQELKERCSFLERNIEEINNMITLSTCQFSNYQYAALYFLGIIANLNDEGTEDVNVIKLHYLLRDCNNPEKIGEDYIIDNTVKFEQLKKIKENELTQIVEVIEEIIKNTSTELWIVAVDYYDNGKKKYKIYVKKTEKEQMMKIYDALLKRGINNLANKVLTYINWVKTHPELKCYGWALCYDNMGKWSLNFYY